MTFRDASKDLDRSQGANTSLDGSGAREGNGEARRHNERRQTQSTRSALPTTEPENRESIMARKINHFYVANEMADDFADWLTGVAGGSEFEALEPVTGKFSPERHRIKFTDGSWGFSVVFMLYDVPKYNCVNVPESALPALREYLSVSNQEADGKLGTARGDGKDDASVAAERESKAKAKAEAKAEAAAERKAKADAAKEAKEAAAAKAKAAKAKATKAKAAKPKTKATRKAQATA